MLSNAYFLAKLRFDTAENEPAKKLQRFANFADPNPLTPNILLDTGDAVRRIAPLTLEDWLLGETTVLDYHALPEAPLYLYILQ